MTDAKRTITVAASNNLRRLASKPGYVTDLERATAPPAAGAFDNAGGPFPYDIPSQAFDHALKQLDEALNQAEHQIAQLRELSASMRAVADGKAEPEPPAPPISIVAAVSDAVEATVEVPGAVTDGSDTVIAPEPTATPPAWTCPIHDQYAQAVSRKGRTYRYCPAPDCGRLDIMLSPEVK